MFKIVASVLVIALAVAGVTTYAVNQQVADRLLVQGGEIPELKPGETRTAEEEAAIAEIERQRTAMQETADLVNQIRAQKADVTSIAIPLSLVTAVVLGIIWLGLGLTFFVVAVSISGLIVLGEVVPAVQGGARLLASVVGVGWSFVALMTITRALLAYPHPVFGIARNVLIEATRLRISMVFLVLFVLLLAALPGWLDAEQPLRYRVQSFLQFGTGVSFWVIAMLVLVFSVATVTLEQRQRVIWQTMTKPVTAWHYVLGKWLGVSALAAVLLMVCGTAVFTFTEYLRNQPAIGEREAFIDTAGRPLSPDRLALESQVLTARRATRADPPPLDDAKVNEQVEARIQNERVLNPAFATTAEDRAKVKTDLLKEIESAYRAVEPGQEALYFFSGLGDAVGSGTPLTLKFVINSGSNRPDILYNLTFSFRDGSIIERQVALGQGSTITLKPGLIDEEGRLGFGVLNGRFVNESQVLGNPETMHFPPDGLELSYSVGSYRINFLRVCVVLWIKLAFLAMLGVTCGTFLSFSVACLVSLGAFLSAEGSTFIKTALESWSSADQKGNVNVVYWVFEMISRGVVGLFGTYAELRPTARLVDGLLLSWGDVGLGMLVLGLWTLVLFAAGVLILRNRELAIYSGQ